MDGVCQIPVCIVGMVCIAYIVLNASLCLPPRSQRPLLVKDHMYGASIRDIKFHTQAGDAGAGLAQRHVISTDKHIVKVRRPVAARQWIAWRQWAARRRDAGGAMPPCMPSLCSTATCTLVLPVCSLSHRHIINNPWSPTCCVIPSPLPTDLGPGHRQGLHQHRTRRGRHQRRGGVAWQRPVHAGHGCATCGGLFCAQPGPRAALVLLPGGSHGGAGGGGAHHI